MTDEFEKKKSDDSRFIEQKRLDEAVFETRQQEQKAFFDKQQADQKAFEEKKRLEQRAYEEKQREYLEACRRNEDKKAVSLLKMVGAAALGMAVIRIGAEQLATRHQNYENITPLLKAGGVIGADGRIDQSFTDKVMTQSQDKTAAALFLNGIGAKHGMASLDAAMGLSGDSDAARQIIKSGNFDVKKDGPQALLHAAALGHRDVFDDLLKAGADPRAAITNGSNDPRWDGTYSRIAQWAGETIGKNPQLSEKAQTPVTLSSAAHMKEVRLSPTRP